MSWRTVIINSVFGGRQDIFRDVVITSEIPPTATLTCLPGTWVIYPGTGANDIQAIYIAGTGAVGASTFWQVAGTF